MGYNHRYHLRCVYREPQFPFIPLLSLSLTYVGNILVRRYRPLTPWCALIFFRTYPVSWARPIGDRLVFATGWNLYKG